MIQSYAVVQAASNLQQTAAIQRVAGLQGVAPDSGMLHTVFFAHKNQHPFKPFLLSEKTQFCCKFQQFSLRHGPEARVEGKDH